MDTYIYIWTYIAPIVSSYFHLVPILCHFFQFFPKCFHVFANFPIFFFLKRYVFSQFATAQFKPGFRSQSRDRVGDQGASPASGGFFGWFSCSQFLKTLVNYWILSVIIW